MEYYLKYSSKVAQILKLVGYSPKSDKKSEKIILVGWAIFSDPISQNRECLLVSSTFEIICYYGLTKVHIEELQENHLLPNCKICTCGEIRFLSFHSPQDFCPNRKWPNCSSKISKTLAMSLPGSLMEFSNGMMDTTLCKNALDIVTSCNMNILTQNFLCGTWKSRRLEKG